MPNEGKKVIWPGWETVRLIGRGSFGAVYEIERDVFGHEEKAALKVISIPQNNSEIEELYDSGYDSASVTATFQSYMQSIVNEYSLMREMNGAANVVNCDDFRIVPHDNRIGWDIFIRMELLTPLTRMLDQHPSDEQVIRIARDMCGALSLCRKHGIIHRDIKPQNIFVSPNGDYKLGDFGIAKTIERTSSGTKVGTYKYMAPEVYNNRPYNMTADIYSLGLVLHWMLNERRSPFMPLPPAPAVAAQEEEARAKRFSGVPIPPPVHGSAALKRVVLKACAYDPRARYQSAEEMLRDLDAISMADRHGAGAVRETWMNETAVMENGSVGNGAWSAGPTELLSQEWSEGPGRFSAGAQNGAFGQAAQPVQGPSSGPVPEKKAGIRVGAILAVSAVALVAVVALVIGISAIRAGSSSTYVEPTPAVSTVEPAVTTETPTMSAWETITGQPAQEVEAVEENAATAAESTPAAVSTQEPTPTPAPAKAPSADDLRALQNDPNYPNDIEFPMEQSYLPAYETMYVKSGLGNSIYLYWDSTGNPAHRRSHYVLEKMEVTVLARENGFSCIIYKNVNGIMVSGWVDSQYLVYQYP